MTKRRESWIPGHLQAGLEHRGKRIPGYSCSERWSESDEKTRRDDSKCVCTGVACKVQKAEKVVILGLARAKDPRKDGIGLSRQESSLSLIKGHFARSLSTLPAFLHFRVLHHPRRKPEEARQDGRRRPGKTGPGGKSRPGL